MDGLLPAKGRVHCEEELKKRDKRVRRVLILWEFECSVGKGEWKTDKRKDAGTINHTDRKVRSHRGRKEQLSTRQHTEQVYSASTGASE